MFSCMSLILVPNLLKYRDIVDVFSDLTREDIRRFERTVNLATDKIFIPIIEAKDKDTAIQEKINSYILFYVNLQFSPIFYGLISQSEHTRFLLKIYGSLREEIEEKVSSRPTRMKLLNVVDTIEEHDVYILKLLPNFDKIISLIESLGTKYYHAFFTTTLALTAVMLAISRKPEAVRSLSIIAKKHADELKPFVANLQISIEPELAPLRKKTSEKELEKAKELRGSILELR